MSTEDNKAVVRRFIEEGWNQKNLALFDELADPSYSHHDPDFPNVRTLEDYKQWFRDNRNAFPDLRVTIDDMIAEGDRVVTRWTVRGTNTGDITTPIPMPATGKPINVTGVTVSRFAGNRLVEAWQIGNTMGLMQQLGVLPTPG